MKYVETNEIKFMIVLKKMMTSLQLKFIPYFKELGLNESEFYVLFALDINGPLTIQKIGQKIDLTSGTMTYVIDKLENKSLIKRVRSHEDRRKVAIELTSKGESFWQETMEQHLIQMKNMFAHLDEKELLQLIVLMKKVGKGHIT